jgi:hypothetical protein
MLSDNLWFLNGNMAGTDCTAHIISIAVMTMLWDWEAGRRVWRATRFLYGFLLNFGTFSGLSSTKQMSQKAFLMNLSLQCYHRLVPVGVPSPHI